MRAGPAHCRDGFDEKGQPMRIEWNIEKKRGNLRPSLTYSVTLEEYEKALALPPVSIVSTVPKPEEERQDYCYPCQYERSLTPKAEPREYHTLEVPSHKGHTWVRSLRLPWRQDNEYPEVEASFLLLREAFERELAAAHASLPISLDKNLESSRPARAAIAPTVLAERFLRIAEKSAARAE